MKGSITDSSFRKEMLALSRAGQFDRGDGKTECELDPLLGPLEVEVVGRVVKMGAVAYAILSAYVENYIDSKNN